MTRVLEALWTRIGPRSPAFTTADAASAANVSRDQASRDLALLARRGLIVRLRTGVWADLHHPKFSPYAVVPALLRLGGGDAVGYVSLLSALSLHGMIAQVPRAIYVVCGKRRARVRRTPVGAYEFYVMQRALVDGYRSHSSGTFDVATPEKAVFDLFYYSVRKGTRFAQLTEITLTHDFSFRAIAEWTGRIRHPSFRQAVANRWSRLKATRWVSEVV